MRALLMAAFIFGGLGAAASAQVPGASETARGGTVPDLGSGVHSQVNGPGTPRSEPGGPGYGIPGRAGASDSVATDAGNSGTGAGAPGMRPANTGTAPSR